MVAVLARQRDDYRRRGPQTCCWRTRRGSAAACTSRLGWALGGRRREGLAADGTVLTLLCPQRYANRGFAGCSVVEITSVIGHRTYQMAMQYISQRRAARAAIERLGAAG